MIRLPSSKLPKLWSEVTLSTRNGVKQNFRLRRVPNERFEEYIDFIMEFYVKNEITHQVAGIPKCNNAMQEYKNILYHSLSEPNVENLACYLYNGKNERIVGMSAIRLVTLDCFKTITEESSFKTEHVARFYKILREWNNIFPVPELMVKLNLDCYFDDCGVATHADYKGFGIATEMTLIRRRICREYGVRATGAWVTALGSQLAGARCGCQTVFEISYQELGNRLKLDFKNIKHTCKYMICSTST